MLNYIKKLTNINNFKNFIIFLIRIKNPIILLLAVMLPKNRTLTFYHENKKLFLVYRNIHDLAIIFEIFVTSVYPRKHIKNSKVMADVGGHCGYTAIWASTINPNLKIYSYEPEIESQEIFENNIKLNKLENNITLNRYGLGSKDATMQFYKYENNADNSTVLHKGRKPERVYNIKIKDSKAELEKIKPDFLKVDIEGFEDEVIYNYFSGIQKPKFLAIEFSDNLERKSEEAIKKWLDFIERQYVSEVDCIVVNSVIK